MREENKATYYVGKLVTSEDEWGAVTEVGYAPLSTYTDLVNELAETEEAEKFGMRVNEMVRIAHDDNDGTAPDMELGDGVWFVKPTESDGYYQEPPFKVESVQAFRTKHVYILRRTVYER